MAYKEEALDKQEQDESLRITELDSWIQLVSSEEWNCWIELQKRHMRYLQEKVNVRVRSQNWYEAFAAEAQMRDVKNQIDRAVNRIKELKKGGK